MTQGSSPPPATPSVTDDRVRDLALYAGLPLAAERHPAIAAILNAWIPDANALSEKMSSASYQTLVPATVFSHPSASGEESAQ